MTIDIGERLRAIRARHGLSQRELARRSGISNATISMIESNRLNPSVGSLKRLLDGVPMGMAEFFAFEPATEKKVFFAASELVEIADGAISYAQVGAGRDGRAMQILHECYQPGADTGKILLRHDAEEGGVVVRGRIEIWVGNQRRVLQAGDAYYFDSRTPHRFRNIGDTPCEIVSACTPPSF